MYGPGDPATAQPPAVLCTEKGQGTEEGER